MRRFKKILKWTVIIILFPINGLTITVIIHEFIQLMDKTDGDTDGVPEILLQHQYTLPWLDMIHKNIAANMKNKSDINPYGATSQAEFFAVISEYFLNAPICSGQNILNCMIYLGGFSAGKRPEVYSYLKSIYSPN